MKILSLKILKIESNVNDNKDENKSSNIPNDSDLDKA